MSKQFVLSDASVNSYGFSINLAKLDLERFKKNPVLLYNHGQLVGRWEDLRLEDEKLLGTPVFMEDEKEELSLKVKKRVEEGFIKGASLGINITNVEHNGQHPIVDAEVYECSVVDIPSNKNAVVLYDENHTKLEGEHLQLALNSITKNPKIENTMKLSAKTLTILALGEDADNVAIDNAVLVLSQERDALKTKVENHQKEQVDTLISTALSCGQIKATQKEQFEKLAQQDFELAKSTIDALPKAKKLAGKEASSSDSSNDRADWTFEDWRKKDTAGLLAIKENDPEQYAEIIKK